MKIFLDQDSTQLLDSYEEPVIFLRLDDVELLPYSKKGEEVTKKPKIIFRDTRVSRIQNRYPDSHFNF